VKSHRSKRTDRKEIRAKAYPRGPFGSAVVYRYPASRQAVFFDPKDPITLTHERQTFLTTLAQMVPTALPEFQSLVNSPTFQTEDGERALDAWLSKYHLHGSQEEWVGEALVQAVRFDLVISPEAQDAGSERIDAWAFDALRPTGKVPARERTFSLPTPSVSNPFVWSPEWESETQFLRRANEVFKVELDAFVERVSAHYRGLGYSRTNNNRERKVQRDSTKPSPYFA
jgi:hypothetical protein